MRNVPSVCQPGLRQFALVLGLALAAAGAAAQSTPVGLWKTFDDDTGIAKSLVRIVDSQGVLNGRIEKLLDPDDPADPICDKCTDDRRNRPVLGMAIIRNVRRGAGQTGPWEGGDILDPDNGKVYHVRLTPSPDGRRLEVRGYVGAPLFGRTQSWSRVE